MVGSSNHQTLFGGAAGLGWPGGADIASLNSGVLHDRCRVGDTGRRLNPARPNPPDPAPGPGDVVDGKSAEPVMAGPLEKRLLEKGTGERAWSAGL